MRVSIDKSLCTGHGRCFSLAPEVFGYDEEGFGMLKLGTITPALETPARLGAGSCPEQAVTVDDD